MKSNTKVVSFGDMIYCDNEDGEWLVDSTKYTKEQVLTAYKDFYGDCLKKSDLRVVWAKQIGNDYYIWVNRKPTNTTNYKRCWHGNY